MGFNVIYRSAHYLFKLFACASLNNQSAQTPIPTGAGTYFLERVAYIPKLQCFDPTAILEYVEEDLDLPSAVIPFDQFTKVVKCLRGAIGQPSPLDRLDAVRPHGFLGNQVGVSSRNGKIVR